MTTESELKPAPYMPVKAKTEHWASPPRIVEPVRKGLGSIDFDPCSNPYSRVGAERQVWLPEWLVPVPPSVGKDGVEDPGRPAYAPTPDVILGDGLEVEWRGNGFFNPPYNAKGLAAFMAKAASSARVLGGGAHSVGLLPIKSDQEGYQTALMEAAVLTFIRGRVRHLLPDGTEGDGATFPQVLVLWTRSWKVAYRYASEVEHLGHTIVTR
jgi:hypothetical protein